MLASSLTLREAVSCRTEYCIVVLYRNVFQTRPSWRWDFTLRQLCALCTVHGDGLSFAAHKWRGPALSSTVSVIQYTLQRLITSLIKFWVATKPVGVSLATAGGPRSGSLAGLCCRQPIAGASSGFEARCEVGVCPHCLPQLVPPPTVRARSVASCFSGSVM